MPVDRDERMLLLVKVEETRMALAEARANIDRMKDENGALLGEVAQLKSDLQEARRENEKMRSENSLLLKNLEGLRRDVGIEEDNDGMDAEGSPFAKIRERFASLRLALEEKNEQLRLVLSREQETHDRLVHLLDDCAMIGIT